MKHSHALCLLLFFFTYIPSSHAEQPPALVGIDAVVEQAMQQTMPVLGRLVALHSGVVAARTAGPVANIKVEVGNHVEKGTVVAVLDQARLKEQVELQIADIKVAKAQKITALAHRKLARKELARLEKIRKSPAFTQSLYDVQQKVLEVALSTIKEAEARILRAEAYLRLARIELRDSTILAPYTGVITQRHTSEGAWLTLGDPVVSMVDHLQMEIEAQVPAEHIIGIQVGHSVSFQLNINGNTHYQAQVRAIIPEQNPSSRTLPVRFQPQFNDQTSQQLALNQSVTLLLPVQSGASVLTVHKDAVLHTPQGTQVFVVQDGVASPRSVELGEAIGQRLQVISGLTLNEQVVIRGNERLRPGQAVQSHDKKGNTTEGKEIKETEE